MFFETHLDAMDIQVVLQKLTTMQVYRALVVYDAEFAIHGLGPLKEQAESHNFTLSFVPLEANRTRVKEVINQTLWRLKQINSYFTSFAMLLFSSFTIADRLEAELIDEGVLDPSMRTLAFYSGFDLGLSGRYKQHHIRYPYEKVIYVILRRFHEKARKLLKTATAQRNSEDKALSFADCFAVVFLNVIMEYMSSVRLPETMDSGTAMDDFLEGMKKNLTSEMKTLRMHRSTIRYYTFYLAPVRSKVYRLKHVDTWKQKDGRLERTIVMTEVEAYLKNREIKVALQEYPPYVVYEKSPTGETTVNGTLPILLDYIQQKFKFRASYQLLENVTTAGIRLDEYNWTGALGMLNQRETDMVTFLDFTEARSKSFTLTTPLASHPVVIIVQTPRILYRQWLFMQPFTTQVWLLIVASVPVVSVALWLVYNRCPEEAVRPRKVRGLSRLQNCAWYLYGALLQQGGVHLPVGTSSRLVVGAWWIYVVLVMSCYSSTLVAFLSVPVPRWVVASFREALQREDVHIYLPGGTGVEDMVRKSMNEEIVDLRKRLERGRGASIMNVVSDALDPVAAGKGILIGDVMYLRALVMADHRKHGCKKCRITILNDVAFDITITIGTRKGSPFIQALDDVLMKLRTTGNHRFMLTDHQEKQHPCIRNYDAEVGVLTKPIGLSELESAFLLLLLGTAASSMLVPIEFVAHWARTRCRARKLTSPTPAVTWPALSRTKGRRYISLQHGWKRANDCIWTTVGPGGHVLTDTYPAFGRFGRRPLYLKEAPSFPFYEGCRPSRVRVNDALSSQVGLEMQKGHIVIVGAWP
ncbi:glutamate receptor ionotropic, delta-1-like [Haemaphysalis longicornis]